MGTEAGDELSEWLVRTARKAGTLRGVQLPRGADRSSRPSGRGSLRWDKLSEGLSRKGVTGEWWVLEVEPQERLRDGTSPCGSGRSKPLRA